NCYFPPKYQNVLYAWKALILLGFSMFSYGTTAKAAPLFSVLSVSSSSYNAVSRPRGGQHDDKE
ncbi:hypothetical protein, partial [uncultured Oscillibacter sp.]|uniref:hypothetical protein n=1 Tax=uncultured Oscillibacter sp. TaxID=876091 RepID=UPI002622ED9C